MSQQQWLSGFHAVFAVLQNEPHRVLSLYCQEKKQSKRLEPILALAQELDIKVQRISDAKLEQLTGGAHHQGVLAQVNAKPPLTDKALLTVLEKEAQPIQILVLEGVQDPHNLGACLRSAEALGVDYVVLPKVHTSPMNETVSKVACGAAEIISIVTVSNLVRFLEQIKQLGVWVIGTSGEAKLMINQSTKPKSWALVMGAEGTGLKRLTLDTCDEVVAIPLTGQTQSLNVSVATGICLYEYVSKR